MTINEAIKKGSIELKDSNIEEANLKSRLLMQFILNETRQYMIVNDQEQLNKKDEQKFLELIDKLKENVPIEHITNQKEFMKLMFFVDENVLIPRQDTEILVEEVINIAKKIKAKRILDLCTGSGAIAVSLAKYLENIEIVAVDISNKAINVAKRNAINNNVEDKITFINSDMFENIKEEKFDIIVSNPPYIKEKELMLLDEQVKKEPILALDGGSDGLNFYKKIIKEGYEYLKYNGYICLEIGYDQKEDVMDLIKKEEIFKNTYSKKDLYDNDRIVVTQLK